MLDSNFWRDYFKVYDVLNLVIPYQELMETLSDSLEIREGDIILDAGCGTGNLTKYILEKKGITIGIDFSEEALLVHQKKYPNSEVKRVNLNGRLPFPDNYFDKIVSNNTLYTINPENRQKVMNEFYRILKSEGTILISNVRENWKPAKIYFEHIKIDLKRIGPIKLLVKMLKMTTPTLKMFYFNSKIIKEGGVGNYKFMSVNEQKNLLRGAGFKKITENKLVYADQAIMNLAIK